MDLCACARATRAYVNMCDCLNDQQPTLFLIPLFFSRQLECGSITSFTHPTFVMGNLDMAGYVDHI